MSPTIRLGTGSGSVVGGGVALVDPVATGTESDVPSGVNEVASHERDAADRRSANIATPRRRARRRRRALSRVLPSAPGLPTIRDAACSRSCRISRIIIIPKEVSEGMACPMDPSPDRCRLDSQNLPGFLGRQSEPLDEDESLTLSHGDGVKEFHDLL